MLSSVFALLLALHMILAARVNHTNTTGANITSCINSLPDRVVEFFFSFSSAITLPLSQWEPPRRNNGSPHNHTET